MNGIRFIGDGGGRIKMYNNILSSFADETGRVLRAAVDRHVSAARLTRNHWPSAGPSAKARRRRRDFGRRDGRTGGGRWGGAYSTGALVSVGGGRDGNAVRTADARVSRRNSVARATPLRTEIAGFCSAFMYTRYLTRWQNDKSRLGRRHWGLVRTSNDYKIENFLKQLYQRLKLNFKFNLELFFKSLMAYSEHYRRVSVHYNLSIVAQPIQIWGSEMIRGKFGTGFFLRLV